MNPTAALALADARRLPLRSGSIDGAFAAGLLPHLPDPGLGLAELARVIAAGCCSGPAGGWPATTTAPIISLPSPNPSPRCLDLLLRLASRVGCRRRPVPPAPCR